MGNPEVTGLSEDIPDKTPAKISARILKHMISEASKINRKEIRHAVITVPANFDSAMCKATLDAAALAGIEVCNPDGTEKHETVFHGLSKLRGKRRSAAANGLRLQTPVRFAFSRNYI